MAAVYRSARPSLTIENAGGKKLGNCYSASYFKITSLRPMGDKELRALREAGFLGYGQEFYITTPVDKRNQPAGHDEVPCIDDQTGQPAINPYSKQPYAPSKQPYYVYECESRVDSSD